MGIDFALEVQSCYSLVITEYTKIDPKNVEDIREFKWAPKIGDINRPLRNVYPNGTVTTIYNTSGLVKRCNKCRLIIYYDSTTCPKQCGIGLAMGSSNFKSTLRWIWCYEDGFDKRSCR